MTCKNLTSTVKYVIDRLEVGTRFSGRDLQAMVTAYYPSAAFKYTDTILRIMRRFRREQIVAVNRNRSIYEKVCE